MKSLRTNFYIVVIAVISATSSSSTNTKTTQKLQKVINTEIYGVSAMASYAISFEQLICEGQIFVDNSMLIDYLIKNTRIVVALPRAFGKTINLDMIKTFFGIQLEPHSWNVVPQNETDAYNIFIKGEVRCGELTIKLKESFLIKDTINDVILNDLASYSIIRLNFGSQNYKTITDIIELIRSRIRLSLEQHVYLVSSPPSNHTVAYFQSEYENLFEILKSDDVNQIALVIPSFAKLLCDIFGDSKVLLLIDEYDAVLNSVFFGTSARKFTSTEKSEIVDLFATIYGLLMKHSQDIYYVFATGIMCWRNSGIFSEFSRIEFNTVAGGNANYFYGMSHDIVDELLKLKESSQRSLKEVAWYFNGYDLGDSTNAIVRYNPYAISRLISYDYNIKKAQIWTHTGDASELIQQLMKYDNFERKFLLLLAGQSVRICVNEKIWLSQNYRQRFSETICNAPNANHSQLNDYPDEEWGFNVLLAAGYLTRSRCNIDDNINEGDHGNTMLVKIPNVEIRNSLWSEYISGFKGENDDERRKERVFGAAQENCSRTLATFLSSACPNCTAFGLTFQKVLDAYPPRSWKIEPNERMAYDNEAIIESILLSVINTRIYASGIQLVENQWQFAYHDQRKPDVVLKTKNGELAIFELKSADLSCNLLEVLESAKNQAVDYAHWYLSGPKAKYYEVSSVKAVALVVTKGGKHTLMRATYVRMVNGHATEEPPYNDYIPVKLNPKGRIVADMTD